MLGLDLETTGLDPIMDKIRLVQLAGEFETDVFDLSQIPIAEFTPVWVGGSTKIIHNAKFDAGFIWDSTDSRVMPEPIFDTMLADQVIYNRSYPRSLGDLTKEYLGIDLAKELQESDWSDELTSEQLEYAANDAAFLRPLQVAVSTRAEALGLGKILDLENRAIPALVWMARAGIFFDQDRWNQLRNESDGEAQRHRRELDSMVESQPVNWNSTYQVRNTLSALGLNVPDTKHETLESLRDQHPLIPRLIAYREAVKRSRTYGDNWTKFVHPATGRIHADWRQIGAETGRMSCARPNLQNLPRDPRYRSCFRAAPGAILVKADYSQIELRLAAEIAGDERMIQAFKEGQDLHSLAATLITNDKAVGAVTPEQRQLAKAVNFGLIYGMSAKRLAEYANTNFGVTLTETEAADIRNRYFSAFPDLQAWHRRQSRLRVTRTVLGRRRSIKPVNGRTPYTQLLNSPVQGSAADGMKLALARLWETRSIPGAFPVLVVHDEVVVETPEDRVDETKEWLVNAMVEGMNECLKAVPVVVDVQVGRTWGMEESEHQ